MTNITVLSYVCKEECIAALRYARLDICVKGSRQSGGSIGLTCSKVRMLICDVLLRAYNF